MSKRLLCVTLVIILCLGCFSGCSDFESRLQEIEAERELVDKADELMPSNSFQVVARDDDVTYFRDVVTDVMYVFISYKAGYAGMGGLSVMFSPDGSPLLYSEWISLSEEVSSDA